MASGLEGALRRILNSVNGESRTVLNVGFLEGSTYPDGTSVPMVAAIQEFGAPKVGIPPRSYFRTMVARESPQWAPALGALLRDSDYDVRRTLTQMGEHVRGQLQQSIADLRDPPLSPVTLMLRRMLKDDPDLVVTRGTVAEARARVAAGEDYSGVSTKPLVDTGYLLGSVDFELAKGD